MTTKLSSSSLYVSLRKENYCVNGKQSFDVPAGENMAKMQIQACLSFISIYKLQPIRFQTRDPSQPTWQRLYLVYKT